MPVDDAEFHRLVLASAAGGADYWKSLTDEENEVLWESFASVTRWRNALIALAKEAEAGLTKINEEIEQHEAARPIDAAKHHAFLAAKKTERNALIERLRGIRGALSEAHEWHASMSQEQYIQSLPREAQAVMRRLDELDEELNRKLDRLLPLLALLEDKK